MDERLDWFCGDVKAYEFYQSLVDVSHIWDDLIDGDKPVSPDDVNRVMAQLWLTLPTNEFYQKHFSLLQPLVTVAVISYIASTKLEHTGDEHKVEIAHVLRYAVHQVAIMAFALTGGFGHAVDTLVKSCTTLMPETVLDFKKEH